MADRKISQLPSGGLLQPGDLIPVARNGTNVTVLGGFLAPRKRGPWNSDTQAEPALATYTFESNAQIPSWSYKTGGRFASGNDLSDTGARPTVLSFDSNVSTNDPALGTTAVLASPFVPPNTKFSMVVTASASATAKLMTLNYASQSEGGYDYFRVFVDGTQILEVTGGDGLFHELQYEMTPGTHTVAFEYSKDGSGTGGFDGFRISRLILPRPTFSIPYKFGDIVTYNGKTYSCQTNGIGIDAVPDKSPADWLLIPYDLSTDLDNLGNAVKEVDQRPPGLPYAYSGSKKYRYWRVGVTGTSDNTSRIRDISLRTSLEQPMPLVAVKGQTWPAEWTDGDLTNMGGYATFGQMVYNDFDFGTPTLIKVLSFIPATDVEFVFDVLVSEDGVTYTKILSRYPMRPGPDTLASVNLVIPTFVGQTGYNLTANPQANVGRFLKVNNDGTGFDFGDIVAAPDDVSPFHIGVFGGNDATISAVPVVASVSPTAPNFPLHEGNGDWRTIVSIENQTLRPAVRSVSFQFSHVDDIAAWPSIASWARLRITHPSTEDVEILITPFPTNVVLNQADITMTFFMEDERNGNGFNYEVQYLALSGSAGGSVSIVNQGIQIVEWPQV
jgi:hypothetical protein